MPREVKADEIEGLFKELDRRLLTGFYNYSAPSKKFNIVAVGGTALELINLKKTSKDIDLYIELDSVGKSENKVELAQKLVFFIKQHFDGSLGIGADVSYEGIGRGWNLLGFKINKKQLKVNFRCFTLYI